MGDLPQAALTVAVGVAVFVAGQLLLKLIIEPIQDFRRVRGRIAHAFAYYADRIASADSNEMTPEQRREAADAFRVLASDLAAAETMIPVRRLAEEFGLLGPLNADVNVRAELIGVSNFVRVGDADRATASAEKVEHALRLPRVFGRKHPAPTDT